MVRFLRFPPPGSSRGNGRSCFPAKTGITPLVRHGPSFRVIGPSIASRCLWLLFFFLGVTGCERTNTAGYSREEGGLSEQLSSIRTVRVGGADARGPKALASITDIELLTDPPRLAVADWGAQEIRLFEISGGYLESFGREGEGPGEYRSLQALGVLPSGELVGWDGSLRRITVHGKTEDLVVRLDLSEFKGRDPVFVGVLSDSSFVFQLPRNPMSYLGENWRLVRDTVPLVRFGMDGEFVATLGAVISGPLLFFDRGSLFGVEKQVFGPDILSAAVGGGILAGRTDSSTLRYRTASGESLPVRIDVTGR